MPEALFDDLPILAELGLSFREGMAREEASAHASPAADPAATPAATARRRRRLPWLGTIFVVGLVGTATAAGTLTLLRGSPIPGPSAADTQPSMSPRPDSLDVLDLRAADPAAGHAPFALRIGESEGGQLCATVGQADGDDFGIVGADGRFRAVADGIVDGCGEPVEGDASVVGARVFDARRWRDVRTVVYGRADGLRRADLLDRGDHPRPLPIEDGAFLGVRQGYPEDATLALRLTFDDGHTKRIQLGRLPGTIADPDGPAWSVFSFGFTKSLRDEMNCVVFRRVRSSSDVNTMSGSAPALCSKSIGVNQVMTSTDDFTIQNRRMRPGARGRGVLGEWRWPGGDRRIVWGWARHGRYRQVTVTTTAGTLRKPIGVDGTFGFVLPGDTGVSRITLSTRDGRTLTRTAPGTWRAPRS